MDIHGNPEDRDVHGNSMNSNIWGSSSQGDVYGNPPRDVHGNYSPQSSDSDSGHGYGLLDAVGALLNSVFGNRS